MTKPEDANTAAGGSPLDGGVRPPTTGRRFIDVHEGCGADGDPVLMLPNVRANLTKGAADEA